MTQANEEKITIKKVINSNRHHVGGLKWSPSSQVVDRKFLKIHKRTLHAHSDNSEMRENHLSKDICQWVPIQQEDSDDSDWSDLEQGTSLTEHLVGHKQSLMSDVSNCGPNQNPHASTLTYQDDQSDSDPEQIIFAGLPLE